MGYIYLLREREFIRLNEETYKIGKTKQSPEKRFVTYPKGSEIYILLKVDNCDESEKILLELFKKKFKHRTEYGEEYFGGSVDWMVKLIADHKRIPGEPINLHEFGIDFEYEMIKIYENDIPNLRKIEENFTGGVEQIIEYIYCNPNAPERLVIYTPTSNPDLVSPIMCFVHSFDFMPYAEYNAFRIIFSTVENINNQIFKIDKYNKEKYNNMVQKFSEVKKILINYRNVEYFIFRHTNFIRNIMQLFYKNMKLIRKLCGEDINRFNSCCQFIDRENTDSYEEITPPQNEILSARKKIEELLGENIPPITRKIMVERKISIEELLGETD